MPRNYKKKKLSEPLYTQCDLASAVRDVSNQNLTIVAAAQFYNIKKNKKPKKKTKTGSTKDKNETKEENGEEDADLPENAAKKKKKPTKNTKKRPAKDKNESEEDDGEEDADLPENAAKKKKKPTKNTKKRPAKDKNESEEDDGEEDADLPENSDLSDGESFNDNEKEDDNLELLLMENYADSESGSRAEIGDFILVRFKKQVQKETFVYYVGQVSEKQDDDLNVSFLRQKKKSFVFPHVEDISLIQKIDVKKILPKPVIRRGYYTFSTEFPIDIIIM